MLRKSSLVIKGIFNQHEILIKNFSYLTALQLFNMLVPLVAYPFLIRTLGTEKYGLVVFAQATIAYLVILISFGFNISATHEISIHRNDKDKLSEIVSSIFILKSVLFLLSIFILVALLQFISRAQGYKTLFILSTWACLYEVMFPVWYFQGIEQMKYITYISLTSRLIFLALIFLFVHSPSDYLNVPILYGAGALVAGFVALYIIFQKHKVRFCWPSRATLKYYFMGSVSIFLSNLAISLFVSTNKVLIGAFRGMTEVSYYDLAEKITTLVKIPLSILSQVFFPSIVKKFNFKPIFNVFKVTVVVYAVVTLLIFTYPAPFVLLMGGQELIPAISVLRILICSIPFVVVSNFLGIQILLPLGMKKNYSSSILISSAFYFVFVLVFWVTGKINLWTLPALTLVVEIMITGLMFYFFQKNVRPALEYKNQVAK